MQRAPRLVLLCGIVSTCAGIMLLAMSDRLEGMIWLAAPITGLGLILVGLWIRSVSRPAPPEDTPESIALNLPGRWYPFAILGIGFALACWFAYWTKLR